jgi:putative ABC transport system permease protein
MSLSIPAAFRLMTRDDFRQPGAHGITLMVRGMPGIDVLSAVREELLLTNPGLTLFNVDSVENEMSRMLYASRTTMLVYGGIGVFGLVLAAVGLGGVTAYAVARRTKEIGIRVALGASKFNVLKLVTREGAALIVIGTVIGQAGAYALTVTLSSWFNALSRLTETSTSDPLLLFGAPVLLALLTMVSCYLPARRSMRIDPAVALREE